MLTPSEELGLSGRDFAARVRRAFDRIDEPTLRALNGRLRDEAWRRHLIYLRDGQPEAVRVLARPLTVLPDQLDYLHTVSLTLLNALKRLPELYLADPDVRALLRLGDEEEEWLRESFSAGPRESDPVFGRLDAVVDLASATWDDTLRFVEPNLTGVGGLHLVPTCEGIVADVVVPTLLGHDPGLRLRPGHDLRDLLMQGMLDHMEAIGRPLRTVAFLEPTAAGSGPDEQEAVARHYRARFGLDVLHADPSELALDGEEVSLRGVPVDLAYRDYEVRDLLALGRSGADLAPIRALFRQNRIVSSITGEFDQKAAWEVLTDPELSRRHFHPEERQVFRRHVPWTRLLADRRTDLPDGRSGDLLDYARRGREDLVLKPNRGYGGSGVLLGSAMGQSGWEAAVGRALAEDERWVVQRRVEIPTDHFAVLDDTGAVSVEPFYVVLGFAPSAYGLTVVARASQAQVVNIAQRGGICAVMIGEPSDLMVGGPGAC